MLVIVNGPVIFIEKRFYRKNDVERDEERNNDRTEIKGTGNEYGTNEITNFMEPSRS
jgi:hypothetical protein